MVQTLKITYYYNPVIFPYRELFSPGSFIGPNDYSIRNSIVNINNDKIDGKLFITDTVPLRREDFPNNRQDFIISLFNFKEFQRIIFNKETKLRKANPNFSRLAQEKKAKEKFLKCNLIFYIKELFKPLTEIKIQNNSRTSTDGQLYTIVNNWNNLFSPYEKSAEFQMIDSFLYRNNLSSDSILQGCNLNTDDNPGFTYIKERTGEQIYLNYKSSYVNKNPRKLSYIIDMNVKNPDSITQAINYSDSDMKDSIMKKNDDDDDDEETIDNESVKNGFERHVQSYLEKVGTPYVGDVGIEFDTFLETWSNIKYMVETDMLKNLLGDDVLLEDGKTYWDFLKKVTQDKPEENRVNLNVFSDFIERLDRVIRQDLRASRTMTYDSDGDFQDRIENSTIREILNLRNVPVTDKQNNTDGTKNVRNVRLTDKNYIDKLIDAYFYNININEPEKQKKLKQLKEDVKTATKKFKENQLKINFFDYIQRWTSSDDYKQYKDNILIIKNSGSSDKWNVFVIKYDLNDEIWDKLFEQLYIGDEKEPIEKKMKDDSQQLYLKKEKVILRIQNIFNKKYILKDKNNDLFQSLIGNTNLPKAQTKKIYNYYVKQLYELGLKFHGRIILNDSGNPSFYKKNTNGNTYPILKYGSLDDLLRLRRTRVTPASSVLVNQRMRESRRGMYGDVDPYGNDSYQPLQYSSNIESGLDKIQIVLNGLFALKLDSRDVSEIERIYSNYKCSTDGFSKVNEALRNEGSAMNKRMNLLKKLLATDSNNNNTIERGTKVKKVYFSRKKQRKPKKKRSIKLVFDNDGNNKTSMSDDDDDDDDDNDDDDDFFDDTSHMNYVNNKEPVVKEDTVAKKETEATEEEEEEANTVVNSDGNTTAKTDTNTNSNAEMDALIKNAKNAKKAVADAADAKAALKALKVQAEKAAADAKAKEEELEKKLDEQRNMVGEANIQAAAAAAEAVAAKRAEEKADKAKKEADEQKKEADVQKEVLANEIREKAVELARLEEKLDLSNRLSEQDKANVKEQIDNLTKDKNILQAAKVEAETNARNFAAVAVEAEKKAAVAAETAKMAKEAEANAAKEAKDAKNKQADTEKTLNTERKNANVADVKAARAEAEAEAAKTQAAAAANALNSTLKELDNEREKLSKKTEEAARTQGKLDNVEEMGPAAAATAAAAAATAAATAAAAAATTSREVDTSVDLREENADATVNAVLLSAGEEEKRRKKRKKKNIFKAEDFIAELKKLEKWENIFEKDELITLAKDAYDSLTDLEKNKQYYGEPPPETDVKETEFKIRAKKNYLFKAREKFLTMFKENIDNTQGTYTPTQYDLNRDIRSPRTSVDINTWAEEEIDKAKTVNNIRDVDRTEKKKLLLYWTLCIRMGKVLREPLRPNNSVGGSGKKLKYSVKISNHNGKNTNNVGKQFSQNKGRQRKKSVKRRKR